MLSIYIIFKNMSRVEFLIKLCNIDFRELYEIICVLMTIALVCERYRDERAVEKTKKCLE